MRFASRVEYRERQRLRVDDLGAEQDFLLGLSGRHYVGPHTWGCVCGLHVSADGATAVIPPGLAIDGYGREIVVHDKVELSLHNLDEQFVYLYYCERSQGRCRNDASGMGRDVAELMLSESRLAIPEAEPDFSTARAAGKLCDYPPWPILLARVTKISEGKFEAEKVDEDYGFVGLRASRVVSPTGLAVMQIGQESLADPYHFLVSSRDKQGKLKSRFAVARAGDPIFWGNLLLLGSRVSSVTLALLGDSIRIEPKSAAGGDLYLASRVERTAEGKENLVISFRSGRETEELAIPFDRDGDFRSLDDQLKLISRDLKFVRVGLVDRPVVARALSTNNEGTGVESTESASGVEPAKPIATRETRVEYEGTTLLLEQEKRADVTILCGCRETDQEDELGPALVLRAGPSVPLPPTRDIYTIGLDVEGKPEEQTRISAGTFAEGDFRSRFSIGARTDDQFKSWLFLLGNGTVGLPYELDDDGKRPLMLDVKGTIHLPPIKPDPRDRVFNYLMSAAFISGILSNGTRSLVINQEEWPPFIEPSQPWQYKLVLFNKGVAELTEPQATERLQPGGDFRPDTPAKIGINKAETATISHLRDPNLEKVPHLDVHIQISMLAGTRRVATETKHTIPVRKSPKIALDQQRLPDTVPPGWGFPIHITNSGDKAVTLVEVKVENLVATPEALVPVTPVLSAGQATDTVGVARIPPGTTAEIRPRVTLKYRWADGSADMTFTDEETRQVAQHVKAIKHATPSPNQAWKFDLELKNVINKGVTLTGLDVAVYVLGSPVPNPLHFDLNVPLKRRQSFKQADIDGIVAPAGTVIRVDVLLNYFVNIPKQVWNDVFSQLEITI